MTRNETRLIKKIIDTDIHREYLANNICLLRAIVEAGRVAEIPVDVGVLNISEIEAGLLEGENHETL